MIFKQWSSAIVHHFKDVASHDYFKINISINLLEPIWIIQFLNFLIFLAARVGLIVNTLNPAYKSNELEYALIKSEAKLLFLPGEKSEQKSVNDFWKVLRSINLDATSLESVVSLDSRIEQSLNKSSIKLAELDHLFKSDGKKNDFNNVNADDPAIIMFTSGNMN